MRKLIALILIALFIPISHANAQEPLNAGVGSVYPQYIVFNSQISNIVIDYPSAGVVGLAKFPITMLNTNANVSAMYFGLSDCNGKFHGNFLKKSFALGIGPNLRNDTLEFLIQNLGSNCPIVILNVTVAFAGGLDSTSITQRIPINTQFGVAEYLAKIQAEAKAKADAEAKAKAEAEAKATPVVTPWIETHIQDIDKITEGWKKATEALIANQKAEASALILKQQAEKLKRDLVNGSPCTKLGSTKLAGGQKFTCKKISKKLVWR